MDEKEYYKLLIEQYKIMVGSTEKVTDQRQKANSFFLTIVTALISLIIVIGKAFEFSLIGTLIIIGITLLNLFVVEFWDQIITSYGKLNKGKFVLIFELEKKLKANLFEREWEILTNKDNLNYTPTTRTELNLVRNFRNTVYVLLFCEFFYLFFLLALKMCN